MNTILHKLKIFAVILAILIGNGKTILVYALLLRRFDFNILWNLYYELLYDCWYKRKRKDYQGRVLLLFMGSIIQKNFD